MLRFCSLLLLVPALSLVACSTAVVNRPACISSLSIEKKHEYIRHSKATLRNLQSTATDLRLRRKPKLLRELAGEVKRYVDLHILPVVGDATAGHDLQTRLEVAKLQLLGGLVYIEVAEYGQAANLLAEMERRYGRQADILTAALDRKDIGFSTIGDGLQHLHERIEREDTSLPLSRFLALPGLPRI